MTQGTVDEVWPAEGTRVLERKLRAAGRDPEVHYFEGEGHTMRAAARNRQLDLMTAFFERHLARRSQD